MFVSDYNTLLCQLRSDDLNGPIVLLPILLVWPCLRSDTHSLLSWRILFPFISFFVSVLTFTTTILLNLFGFFHLFRLLFCLLLLFLLVLLPYLLVSLLLLLLINHLVLEIPLIHLLLPNLHPTIIFIVYPVFDSLLFILLCLLLLDLVLEPLYLCRLLHLRLCRLIPQTVRPPK